MVKCYSKFEILYIFKNEYWKKQLWFFLKAVNYTHVFITNKITRCLNIIFVDKKYNVVILPYYILYSIKVKYLVGHNSNIIFFVKKKKMFRLLVILFVRKSYAWSNVFIPISYIFKWLINVTSYTHTQIRNHIHIYIYIYMDIYIYIYIYR